MHSESFINRINFLLIDRENGDTMDKWKEMSDGRLCLHKALKKTMPQPNVQGLKIIKGMTSNYMTFLSKNL